MKTRIEEIKAEFQMFVPDDDGSAMDWLENTLEERDRIAREEEAYKWFHTWYEKSIDPATGMFGKWACERLQEIGAEVPRQDIIKALQDK